MVEIPILLSTNQVTVGGFVDEIEISTEEGKSGPRGSRIFTGPSSPVGLPVESPYFGGYGSFVHGDLFIITSTTSTGDIYEYHVGSGEGEWVQIVSKWGMNMYQGTGTPNGAVTATPGSMYRNLSGGAGTTLYVKESGAGNTGWVGK